MPQAIVFALAGAGVPGLVTAAGGLTLVGSIAAAGIGYGISLGVQSLFAEKPTPTKLQNVIRNSVSSRRRLLGRHLAGGPEAFYRDGAGRIFRLVMFSDGEVAQYLQWYIDNREVSIDANGGVTTSPYKPSKQRIFYRMGYEDSEAYPVLIQRYPTIWTPAHKLNGIATGLLEAESVPDSEFSKVYPNRFPVLTGLGDFGKVYDPRTGQTIYSRNAALHLRFYLTHKDGMNLPASLIDDASFSAAANVCDIPTPTKDGGTIARYAIGTAWSYNEPPKDVITRFINATAGRIYLSGEGKIRFEPGYWVAPTITLTDRDILERELTDGSGPNAECNEVIVKYTDPDNKYSEATCVPWRDQAAIDELGDVRNASPEIYEIQHHNHARRIAKILQRVSSPRWQGTIVTNLYGLNCWEHRWVNVTVEELGISGPFEILRRTIDFDTMTIRMQIRSFSSDVFDFDPATEEGDNPVVPVILDDDEIPSPTGIDTGYVQQVIGTIPVQVLEDVEDPETGEISQDYVTKTGTIVQYALRASWSQPDRDDLKTSVEYKRSEASTWTPLSAVAGQTSVISASEATGGLFNIRLRHTSPGGTPSEWVYGTDVQLPDGETIIS